VTTRSDPGYGRSLEVHHRIEALYPRIEQHGVYFRRMTQADPRLPRPPGKRHGLRLDPMVCALAIKAATTKRAVFTLCEAGGGDNAMALTRVLLENACLLEWLIRGRGRQRLEAYVMFTSVQHERVAATLQRHAGRFVAAGATTDIASDPYHRAVWSVTFRDEKGRPTRNERPTWEFDDTTKQGKAFKVAISFARSQAARTPTNTTSCTERLEAISCIPVPIHKPASRSRTWDRCTEGSRSRATPLSCIRA